MDKGLANHSRPDWTRICLNYANMSMNSNIKRLVLAIIGLLKIANTQAHRMTRRSSHFSKFWKQVWDIENGVKKGWRSFADPHELLLLCSKQQLHSWGGGLIARVFGLIGFSWNLCAPCRARSRHLTSVSYHYLPLGRAAQPSKQSSACSNEQPHFDSWKMHLTASSHSYLQSQKRSLSTICSILDANSSHLTI